VWQKRIRKLHRILTEKVNFECQSSVFHCQATANGKENEMKRQREAVNVSQEAEVETKKLETVSQLGQADSYTLLRSFCP